jgi:SAM-dependent methyltransferase
MFWFDKSDHRAHFNDKRRERHMLKDKSSTGGQRELLIDPDTTMDFTDLHDIQADTFHLVVFDPPHLVGNGSTGWLAKKYGTLSADWRDDLRKGFSECFRVLRPNGTLIFKWNEESIPVSTILALTDHAPLFGNRCGKTAKSH